MSVVPLKTHLAKVHEDVIEVLEDVLRQAREGRIDSVAIAITRPTKVMNVTFSSTEDVGRTAGAIQLLMHRFLTRLEDD